MTIVIMGFTDFWRCHLPFVPYLVRFHFSPEMYFNFVARFDLLGNLKEKGEFIVLQNFRSIVRKFSGIREDF